MLSIANIVISTVLTLRVEAHAMHDYNVELNETATTLPLQDTRKNHQNLNKV